MDIKEHKRTTPVCLFFQNKMKLKVIISALFCLVALSGCRDRQASAVDQKVDTIPMLVTQIQKCSRLYTTEYRLHKIITHDDKLSLHGQFMKHDYDISLPLGKRKIAIPMDAVVKAYIDFAELDSTSVTRHGDRIEVTLPDPKVLLTSTTINHNDIKQYVALTRRRFSDEELTAYERQGREAIVKDIPRLDIIPQARENAANILIPMLTKAGFKEADITITFRKDLTPDKLTSLIEKDNSHGK